MRFVFRAEGSATVGFGHLSRAVALAVAARRAGGSVVVAVGERDGAAATFVREASIDLAHIDAPVGSSADAAATARLLPSGGVVVVDGYGFSGAWLAELARRGVVVAYVDDLARGDLACDVVVNPNVCATVADYEAYTGSALVGPDFAIVGERFRAAREAKAPPAERARRILVTMGASDPPAATLDAIAALSALGRPVESRVAVGGANRRRADVEAAARASPAMIETVDGGNDLAPLMLWADVVIAASGVTGSELACVGVPGVAFPIVDNQRPNARAFGERGLFTVPRADGVPDQSSLIDAIRRVVDDASLRQRQFEAQRRTVDGAGKDRIIAALVDRLQRRAHTDTSGGPESD